MSKFFCKIFSGYLATTDSNHMETVELAHFVYCYHASINDVTLVDVGHIVVQVSGATDQDGKNLLLGFCDSLLKKDFISNGISTPPTFCHIYFFFHFQF